ncbi:hypothetical protein V1277_002043 [Bradyrhizobium sp. AZCC 1588]
MSKNTLAEPQPTVVGVSDYIFNHPIRSTASRQVRHDRERARRYKQFRCLRHDHGHEAGCKQRRPDALSSSCLQLRIVRMKVSVKVQHLGQLVFCRRADNGFGHVLIRIMALQGYYQKPSNCFLQTLSRGCFARPGYDCHALRQKSSPDNSLVARERRRRCSRAAHRARRLRLRRPWRNRRR